MTGKTICTNWRYKKKRLIDKQLKEAVAIARSIPIFLNLIVTIKNMAINIKPQKIPDVT
jgi:hypothetical protein